MISFIIIDQNYLVAGHFISSAPISNLQLCKQPCFIFHFFWLHCRYPIGSLIPHHHKVEGMSTTLQKFGKPVDLKKMNTEFKECKLQLQCCMCHEGLRLDLKSCQIPHIKTAIQDSRRVLDWDLHFAFWCAGDFGQSYLPAQLIDLNFGKRLKMLELVVTEMSSWLFEKPRMLEPGSLLIWSLALMNFFCLKLEREDLKTLFMGTTRRNHATLTIFIWPWA